jgi:hypothetical protein
MCEKCRNSGNDNCTGCSHFESLLGYDISIDKKNPTSDSKMNSDSVQKAASSLKGVDFKKTGDQVGDFLKGIKSPTPAQQSSGSAWTPSEKKSKFNYAWIIGIVLAVVVMVIAFRYFNKK